MISYKQRQADKELRAKYRAIAKQQLLADSDCAITIPEYGGFHQVEDGAFVEAVIWVPKEKL